LPRRTRTLPQAFHAPEQIADLNRLVSKRSFIIAVNAEGLWIVTNTWAHERVLFEQHLEARRAGKIEAQRHAHAPGDRAFRRARSSPLKKSRKNSRPRFRSRADGPKSVATGRSRGPSLRRTRKSCCAEILDGIEREKRGPSQLNAAGKNRGVHCVPCAIK